MNDFEESAENALNLAAIDRLVAGDLPDLERRELLRQLEADPDGWRRCALAFLEDQAWRGALSSFGIQRQDPLPVAPTPKRTQPKLWLVRRLSIAASILALAFSAGFAAGGSSRRTPEVILAQQEPAKSVRPAEPLETDQVREVGWIDIVDNSNGESPPRRVPIVSGPGLDEQWLRDQAPTIPDYVRARWERQGYQIQERRDLVSVTLEDGRRVSIPVDEVALDYVGQQPL